MFDVLYVYVHDLKASYNYNNWLKKKSWGQSVISYNDFAYLNKAVTFFLNDLWEFLSRNFVILLPLFTF